MKRFIVFGAAVAGFLSVFAGVALAAQSVTLDISPSPIVAGQTTTLSGDVSGNENNCYVVLRSYATSDCSGTGALIATIVTSKNVSTYSTQYTPSDATTHSEYIQTALFNNGDQLMASSTCSALSVTAAPTPGGGGGQTGGGGGETGSGGGNTGGGDVTPPPAAPALPPRPENGIFLCYSAFQTQPGAWLESQAKKLFAQGYWMAYAVKGNVPGGTNVGKFHLVCNLAGTQAVTDELTGDAGENLGPAFKGVFGLYPVIGG